MQLISQNIKEEAIVYYEQFIKTPCLFVRKLIEGEDSRLSSMVQTLSVMGDLPLAANVSMCAGALSDSDTSGPTATPQDKPSNDSKMSEKQGTKTSETKTVLIR